MSGVVVVAIAPLDVYLMGGQLLHSEILDLGSESLRKQSNLEATLSNA